MPLLSSSIVKQELATVQEVEQALARQSAYGGDLLTNLLEIVPLREERIAAVLSETFGMEAAPVGELPRPGEQVRRVVPSEVAVRFACAPIEEAPGTLVIAVSERSGMRQWPSKGGSMRPRAFFNEAWPMPTPRNERKRPSEPDGRHSTPGSSAHRRRSPGCGSATPREDAMRSPPRLSEP